MPLLSAFTQLGVWQLTAGPTRAQQIYRSLINNLGDNYDVSKGSRMDAFCYALAMAVARAQLTLIHAGLQISPPCVTEMMGEREDEWQIVPGPLDTLSMRRAVLAAREKLVRGARREAVVDALATLLGDDFVWYYTTKPADIATWPLDAGDQPMNLQLPAIPRKLLLLPNPISTGLGSPQTVQYTLVSGSTPLVGDTFAIDGGSYDRAETVVLTAVSSTTIRATFNNPHDANTYATTAPYPLWTSNQRHNLVITTTTAALDLETRRKVNELMARILRGVSTWSVIEEVSPGVAGPFIIGTSPIGATPFGTVTYP